MSSLYSTIFGVFGYIILGFILKKINIIPDYITNKFNFICFNILLPIALISNFWRIKFPEIILFELLLVFFGSGIIIFIIGFFFSKKIFNFKTDDSALFGLGSCFGNSVAFGIPLMYSILGPINSMPYMVLVLFHGLIHFTYATLIIEGYRNREETNFLKLFKIIIGLLKNIVLFGMFIGILLNYLEIPLPNSLNIFLLPISKIALPAVLISLGFSLAGFKIISEIRYSIILTILKNFLFPCIAFVLAKFIFVMPNQLVFIITTAAALPSGSQTYYFSYRYNSLQKIISSNIVLSTFVSFFTISFIFLLFGY